MKHGDTMSRWIVVFTAAVAALGVTGGVLWAQSSTQLVSDANQKMNPQAPTTVACDDSGGVAWGSGNANDFRLELQNDSSVDICVRWGTSGVPNRADRTSCSVVLGSHSGSGTREIYTTPMSMRVASLNFECDASTSANLVVVAWRR